MGDNVDQEQGKETDAQGNAEPVEEPTGKRKLYIWLDCLKAVAELTNYNFSEIYEMPALEFFTYVRYVNFDRKRQEREIKKAQKRKR